jgi:hypothetical protein
MYLTIVKEWLPLIVIGFNVAMFVIIKFNDMKHLEASIKRIEDCVLKITEETCKNGERIATIEGKCTANHG